MKSVAVSIGIFYQKKWLSKSHLLLWALLVSLLQACCPNYVRNLQATFTHQDLVNKVEKTLILEDYLCKEKVPYCQRDPKSAELFVKLDLGEEYNFGKHPFKDTVKVQVEAFTFKPNERPSNWINPRIYIFAISTEAPEQLIQVDFTGDQNVIRRFKIKVTSYTNNPDLRNAIRLTAEVRMDWKVTPIHALDPSLPLVFVEPVKAPGNPVNFRWQTACHEIKQYQFQLLRLFNEDKKKTSETDIFTTVDWDKALTLDVSQDSVVLTLAEGTGFYIWRVRPIGSVTDRGAADNANWGLWSEAPPSGRKLSLNTNNPLDDYVLFYRQFDEDKNWIYSRTFSEDNKIAEDLTYANGLLQTKQQQRRLQSSEIVLTNQTLYDYSGRPALQSMAAPVKSPAFQYIDRFLEQNGNNYGPEHFDANRTYRQPQPLTGGALHQYYSDQNPSLQIPSAEGFPFSRTLYYGDGTDQLKEIGGVGPTFQLTPNPANSRTTQLFFVGSADDELIRIFGDEAPSKDQVFKTITINPNKTVSVVFSDVNGDTLATCLFLSKGNIDMLDPLPERKDARETIVAEIRGPDPFESAREFLFTEPTEIDLHYSIDPNLVNDPCFSDCRTCDYRVIFTIFKKDDPQDGFPRSDTLVVSPGFCESSPRHWTKKDTLQPGSYIIRKRIKTHTSPKPGEPSFLEKKQADLLNQLTQQLDQATEHFFRHLDKANLRGLYKSLKVEEGDTTAIIQTDCCQFVIPVERCETVKCPEKPDFEKYFIDYWGKEKMTIGGVPQEIAGTTNGKYNFLPDYEPGQFNQLIHNMLNDPALANDPSGPYQCDKLWQCWTGLTQAYKEMAERGETRTQSARNAQFTLSNTTPKYDLLDQFFTCIGGRRLRGLSNIPYGTDFSSPGYLSHAYAYIFCDPNKKQYKDCAIVLTGTRIQPADWCTKSYPKKNLEEFLGCISGEEIPNYQDVLKKVDVTKIQEGCESICEKRKFSFLQSLEQAYLDLGYKKVADLLVGIDTIQPYELKCKAQQLIEQCKAGCKLSVIRNPQFPPVVRHPDSWDSIGTAEEIEQFKNSITAAHKIALPLSGQCPEGYTATQNEASYAKTIVSYLNDKLQEFLSELPSPSATGVFDVEQAFKEANAPLCERLESSCFKQKIPVSKSQAPVFRLGVTDTCQLYLEIHRLVVSINVPPRVVTDRISICENLCGCTIPCEKVCLKWEVPKIDPLFTLVPQKCPERNAAYVRQILLQQMARCKADHLAQLKSTYQQQCLDRNSIRDRFTVSYAQAYYHYTLFYYDRAGNLVRTVAPKGVDTTSKNRMDHPKHNFVSTYDFNSLGQVIKSQNPDGGAITYYYDDLQQLRFTQNDKQRNPLIKTYSYNIYDYLGRVIESGESSQDIAHFPTRANEPDFPDDPSQKTEFTKTVYSIPSDHLKRPQRFLQNRISYAYTHENAYTYYSYDPHGNLEWIADSIPGLGIKYIDYEYDLISGLVTQVRYNTYPPGSEDRFYHRYTYDADNRLVQVETSVDSMIWDRDARYEYFAHGPLKRTVIGEDRVQGVDYTYTLQGWLKGINHPSLDRNKDPGKDGAPGGPNETVGKDAFGMTLSYFEGDFSKQGAFFTGSEPAILSPKWGLFDGNIASWTTQLAANPGGSTLQYDGLTGSVYRYDELNRLRDSKFHHFDNRWIPTQDYSTHYAYDPNGNMDTLIRNGYAARHLGMDSLSYHYAPFTNKLTHLFDKVSDEHYEADLDAQFLGNYQYDELGNLIRDASGEIDTMDWNVSGKIKHLDRFPLSQKPSLQFRYNALGERIVKEVTYPGNPVKKIITYYIRGPNANPLAIYQATNDTLRLAEHPIYGEGRIGTRTINQRLSLAPSFISDFLFSRIPGNKKFELTDHLGNVRALISDLKLPIQEPRPQLGFEADLLLRNDFFPFGMMMPNRDWKDLNRKQGYRYAFNGMEQDSELYEEGSSYTTQFRQYDSKVGRWLSVDPVIFPSSSPFIGFANNPNRYIDPNGSYGNPYSRRFGYTFELKNSLLSTAQSLQAARVALRKNVVSVNRAYSDKVKMDLITGDRERLYRTLRDREEFNKKANEVDLELAKAEQALLRVEKTNRAGSNIVLGGLGAVGSIIYIGGTEGVGAALGGVVALNSSVAQFTIGIAQALDAATNANSEISKVNKLSGLFALGLGREDLISTVEIIESYGTGFFTGSPRFFSNLQRIRKAKPWVDPNSPVFSTLGLAKDIANDSKELFKFGRLLKEAQPQPVNEGKH